MVKWPALPGDASPIPARSPRRATYRVQLHAGFTFDDASAVADYLASLGVSHLYTSPVLQAAAGSTHGYDVVDPARVNTELGGEAGYERLQAALGRAGLGQLLDVVPNHMAITGADNAWWWDVLENGPASVYASYFDVDWDPPESKLRNLVLLPILGDHYGRELEGGRLRLAREGGRFVIRYYDHAVPVAPRTLDGILATAAARIADAGLRGEVESIATAFGRLPLATDTDPAAVAERHRDKEILADRLGGLVDEHPDLADALDDVLEVTNRDPDELERLLDRQNYRLAWWRTAGEELDYRRFFDINGLAAIRVEDPQVFADSHRRILEWLRSGVIDGVRIDHVDGLRDPARYLERLRQAAPDAWVVVEKILEGDEELPPAWPVHGTTGYDWCNAVGDLMVDPAGWEQLVSVYRAFTGVEDRYDEVVARAKAEILDGSLATDLHRLAAALAAICERHRRYRDFSRRDLRDGLAAVASGFGVYRTYLRPGQAAEPADVATVEAAVLSAGLGHPDLDPELLQFVRDLLLLRVPGDDEQELALRFQQLTGPVMAKAVEDTAFYRWLPLTGRNEVGADPGRLDGGVAPFHRRATRIQEQCSETLLATSTHDTKRSEDVRARLAVLAEDAAGWAACVRRWHEHHERRQDGPLPDRNTEWLLYQTVVGAWPIDAERLTAYLAKATREAKEHTSWTDPDVFYDGALRAFAEAALADETWVAQVEEYVAWIRRAGWVNSLGQKLLTLTAPGVADLYQGSELWDLSLVDPDNRRPVDYELRRRLLAEVAGADAGEVWRTEDGGGLSKLVVVARALALRAEHPPWFGPGAAGRYEPLEVA
ncbi:MAG: malto-oligosyltrehalose synthase, partial [Acidimicrobiales bacterium]